MGKKVAKRALSVLQTVHVVQNRVALAPETS